MRYQKLFLAFATFAVALFGSCGETEKPVEPDACIIKDVQPGKELDPQGGSFVITYEASRVPEATMPEWVSLSSTRSISEGTLTFTYEQNNTGVAREGKILIKAGKKAAHIIVTQEATKIPVQEGNTAMIIASEMFAGINIGNTMECPGQEGAWSKPVNPTYVASLAKMGFNAVRIPCAFDSHVSDASTNTIDQKWLDRVDEVVGYVIDNGMYAILNIHWDGGWLENSCKEGYDEKVNQKQHDYWTQIANKLNHYDEHLLFAAMNEPNNAENGAQKEESIKAIMKYQQTMLDAVRATGGKNAERVLVMQAPSTSNEIAVEGLYQLPKDVLPYHLMIETHFYGPYQFNMMEEDANWGKCFWYWGKDNHVAGSDHNSTYGEEEWVKEQFDLIKKYYVDKGIPGITGEYCVCCNRENTKGIDRDKWRASARLWAKVVTRESKNAGMVPFFWETGGDINRTTGEIKNSLQIDGVFEGAAEGKYPF